MDFLIIIKSSKEGRSFGDFFRPDEVKWFCKYLCWFTKQLRCHPSNADAVVADGHGRLLFVEPYEVIEPFDAFLSYVQNDISTREGARTGNVRYAQTRGFHIPDEVCFALKS